MKIRTSLTLRYTCVTAVVFLAFVIAVFYVGEYARSNSFFRTLRAEAITKAHLFLNNKVDAQMMQSTYLNNKQFIDEVEVAVYSPDFEILYHDALQNDIIKESSAMIEDILRRKEIDFYIDKYQGIGIVYPFGGKTYVVTAAAYDGYGYANLQTLRQILGALLVIGLTVLVIVGYYLARSAFMPICRIVKKAEEITASRMDCRLPVENEHDELGELSIAFNELLERLDKSFNSQKMFISNVSHELRTPMAALTAQLDLALLKDRTPAEYQTAIGNALQDSQRVIKLINGLLDLAKSDYQPEQLKMNSVRLDELIIDAIDLISRAHPDYHVELIFEQESDNDDVLIVVANSYLLTTAFMNLIENNCKYSLNKTSFIQISFWEGNTIVRLSDNGIGMSDTDKEKLFELFYRGDNQGAAAGYGIGMTLTRKILLLHKGDISVFSHKGEGTTYVVKLPHI
ncbi:MAG: HAMP domain-containing sensor histidine kinase [Bacteroidales bacterium]